MKIHLPYYLPVLLLISVLGSPLWATAQTNRYVAVGGTDAGNCPAGSPCATIDYAVRVADPGDIIRLAAGTYHQQASISKSITLQGAGAGTDPALHTIITGANPALPGRGITLDAGITHITIKDLRVQDFGSGSGIYGSGSNNNLSIQHVQVYHNLGGSSGEAGIHLNGPIANVMLQGIDAQYNSTRGIVIWNGRKENISISDCTIGNNSLSGLELQDGTASGVTITNNVIQNNKDSGLSLVGLSAGAGANLISGNTITDNGRFGIEVKLPVGTGLETGDGSIVLENNRVARTVPIAATELRDLAGIAVYRRNWTTANADIPEGVVIKLNTVVGYRQPSASDGFGIVVEGSNMQVLNNTIRDCDVAVQLQAGHLPYTALTSTDGDQSNLTDEYFGRGNTPGSSGEIKNNIFETNSIDTRYVGVPEPPAFDRTWVGTLSAEWGEENNWQEAAVPNATTSVIVPAGTLYSPVISADQAVASIQIADGATLEVQEGSLQVKGDLQNNGILKQTGAGEVTFTGIQRQTLGSTKILEVENLQVGAAGLELSGPVNIKNRLTLNGTLYTKGYPLTLLADATGETQVTSIAGGKVEGPVTMQRLITGSPEEHSGYEMLASPFTDASLLHLLQPEVPENQILTEATIFEESRVAGTSAPFESGWVPLASFNEAIVPGKAIRAKVAKNKVLSLTGNLQNGAVEVNGLTRGSGPQSGWHLLGNPYASALDWRKVTIPVGMGHALYTLNSNGNYGSYVNGLSTGSQANLVLPMRGFFVRVQEGMVNLSLNQNQLVNPSESKNKIESENRPQVHLQITAGNKKDAAIIYFEEGATAQADSRYDAYKLPANSPAIPMVYSKTDNANLSINGLGKLKPGQEVVVPLGIAGAANGNFTLEASQLLNFEPNRFILLEDRETGLLQDLRQNPVYTFNLGSQGADERFFIHFTQNKILALAGSAQVAVYPNPSKGFLQIYLSNLNQEQSAEAFLYNNLGQRVYQQNLAVRNGRVAESLNLQNLNKGVYVLHLRTQQGSVKRKIVLE
ncbi:hypothetical protein AAE02nite_08290 [Adhaeribacter aerolatus]|uniref:Secretion system C-terminal sorting domain-containing protein n=1 Tax=Adhaeribacter aerolatus TaxID=670289 RepID=A0A512ATX6_9BACT|nr:right-handed parallel beta-helix repeat-containing protein [Adhaeribacter aerolatus]GEO03165.1 hypothetical protein AAE02nite_08290 [Adhaeribacter aerolatus]